MSDFRGLLSLCYGCLIDLRSFCSGLGCMEIIIFCKVAKSKFYI
ncbi:hypothetical protein HPMG_00452 [Helicobacter pullorum MIT 98-5489]|uniref:Uncharacterized protein n=1 Tax=Helicobacter pullorum MIT 98-5489 TaxID=537972 RepID=C5EXI4_9HELI|nr:hypothetical protein HPMG_00452 [Helicobacter pullorum MIT 98-5489]